MAKHNREKTRSLQKRSAKKYTQKLAKQQARTQAATARSRAVEAERKTKEEQRILANASNNESNTEGNGEWNNNVNIREMINKETRMNQLIRMNKERARAYLEKLEKNKLYIYMNNEPTPMKASQIIKELNYSGHRRLDSIFGTPIDILYISNIPEESYYYRLEWIYDDTDEEVSYNSWGPYRTGIIEGYEVYILDPVDFYRSFTEDMNADWYRKRYYTLINSTLGLKRFFLELPEFVAQLKREEQAKYTAPPKLEALQLKGVNATIKQFETKTGKAVPRNTQNIIESFLMKRKPIPQYFEERNNIYKIDPSLFESP